MIESKVPSTPYYAYHEELDVVVHTRNSVEHLANNTHVEKSHAKVGFPRAHPNNQTTAQQSWQRQEEEPQLLMNLPLRRGQTP